MQNTNSQGMRVSLPPGTKISGEKGAYIVKQFICMSSRSMTVLCESSSGNPCRVKLYNGQHTIHRDLLKKTMAAASKGIVLPLDIDEYEGAPFAVYPIVDGTDTGKHPVPQSFLVQRVIPQLAFVIHQYHQKRILLRDICPEHVLYKVQDQEIAYCGFGNMAVLPDKATITKINGYGQHPSFIAPEVPKYGYSTCSDYYALGVTILSMMLGKNPMELMDWNDIQKCLAQGKVPGIDINHLRNTPYDLYNEEDEVLYLVLGLMLPNPNERWGYGEIRCWCNHQHIPLRRKEGRIVYQYNEPFVVGRYKCWNYQQLTQRMAADPAAWTDAVYTRLEQFAKRQSIQSWNRMVDMSKGCQLTTNSRIFRAIYAINPALNGFWWTGKKYADSTELIRKSASDKVAAGMLSEILTSHSLSFFLRMRKRISAVSDADISEMEQIEQWEILEPGKGVNRCMMRFAGDLQARFFRIDGKDYENLDRLLNAYSCDVLRLKKISSEVLANKSFQAWLWANGMEAAGQAAQKMGISDPEQSFYLLLKIAERLSKSEEEKRYGRRLYLQYGEYAPIYWLFTRIDDYKMASIGAQILFDTFKYADLSLAHPIETLSANLSKLVPDYQHFVLRTAKNAREVKNADLEFCDFSFYPAKGDGYFSCRWENGLEVTPAFLKSIGGHVPGSK